MKVHELMTRDVRTCQPEDRTSLAAHIMWDRGWGLVPVVDRDGLLLGVITDRDIAMAAYAQDEPLSALPVARAMTTDARAVHPDQPLGAAEALMRRGGLWRLPVIDDAHRVIGTLSISDLPAGRRRRGGARPP